MGAQQIRSSDFVAAGETPSRPSALKLASEGSAAVRSPALELQETLELMIARPAIASPNPAALLAAGAGLLGAMTACAAFWIVVGRALAGLV